MMNIVKAYREFRERMKSEEKKRMERVTEGKRRYNDLIDRLKKIRKFNDAIEKFPHTIEEFNRQKSSSYVPLTTGLVLISSEDEEYGPMPWEDMSSAVRYVAQHEKIIRAGCEAYVLCHTRDMIGKGSCMSRGGVSGSRFYEYEEVWGLPVKRKLSEEEK